MRRIKTYVIMVGVTLSVAPIFNSAFAQQGSSSTKLLLDVQTLRQEIAELRDMVERQQFQMKRMQRQLDAKQLSQAQPNQGYNNSPASRQQGQPNFGAPVVPQANGVLGQQGGTLSQAANPNSASLNVNSGSTAVQPSTDANQPSNWDVSKPESTDEFYQPYSNSQSADSGVASAANQNVYSKPGTVQQAPQAASQSNYPPVVDRSFSTTTQAVPVTGAGSQIAADSVRFQQARNNQPTEDGQADVSDGGLQASAAGSYQAPPAGGLQVPQTRDLPASAVASVGGGVISVPQTLQQQGAAAANQNSINAAQVPVQGDANQVATRPAAPVPAVVPEDEYYAQGFELLKQSKYEEAASIFEQQLEAHPRGDLADDAHYWIAEAMHVSRKLDVAKVHLKAIINDHPQSRRLPDAMLKTAYIEQSQGNQIEARILFQEIVNMHPQSDAAIAAKNQLAASN